MAAHDREAPVLFSTSPTDYPQSDPLTARAVPDDPARRVRSSGMDRAPVARNTHPAAPDRPAAACDPAAAVAHDHAATTGQHGAAPCSLGRGGASDGAAVAAPEEILALPVVAYFAELGAVFPEVSPWSGGDRADLVVVRDDATLDIVEVKTAPCKKLLRQIQGWRGAAERRWVAFDPPRRGEKCQRWLAAFSDDGVGVLYVVGGVVSVAALPIECATSPFHRDRMVAALTPLHAQFGAAGNARGAFYTPFRHTCDNLRAALVRAPGLTIREAVERISHHYTSDKVARSSLLAWIRKGVVEGVESRADGRVLRLFPLSQPALKVTG